MPFGLTHAEQQLARGQVQDLQHSAAVLLVLLQQGGVIQVEDSHSAFPKAAGQLMAVWVVAAALDDFSRRCQLKQLLVGLDIPASNCAVQGHGAVLTPAQIQCCLCHHGVTGGGIACRSLCLCCLMGWCNTHLCISAILHVLSWQAC